MPAVPVDYDQIASLLRQSRDAHHDYRMNVTRTAPASAHGTIVIPGDPLLAREAVARALALRKEALALDPEQTAPAWRLEPATHQHDELIEFYEEVLARG